MSNPPPKALNLDEAIGELKALLDAPQANFRNPPTPDEVSLAIDLVRDSFRDIDVVGAEAIADGGVRLGLVYIGRKYVVEITEYQDG